MQSAILVLVVSCSVTSALQLPLQPRVRPPSQLASASAAALASLPAVALADDWWIELNKPPITLNPFTINPIGYTVILGYVAYIAWQINKPMSEGEKAALLVREQAAEEAAAAAGPFLQAAREAEGARELPSGLVFRELKAGEGEAPTPDNKVVVHYEGSLADGTVFDSSIKRGEPTEFKVDQVIKGWQEGLQLMRPGSKAVLTLPAEIAYGPGSVGTIPANSTLQFEVQLIEIKEGGGGFLGFGA